MNPLLTLYIRLAKMIEAKSPALQIIRVQNYIRAYEALPVCLR